MLNERSAVPSLTSRATPSSKAKGKGKISASEKARLRSIARKSAIASDGTGKGSADIKTTAAVTSDPWAETAPVVIPGGYAEETLVKRIPKAPKTLARQRENYLSSQVEGKRGLELPDEGTSYNPAEAAHARLIELAVEEEKAAIRREEAEAERIATLGEVVNARRQPVEGDEYAPGMQVGPGEIGSDDESDSDVEDKPSTSKAKANQRKTQAQRNKKRRAKELARLEAIEKTQKRLAKSIGSPPNVQSSIEAEAKRLAEAQRLAQLAKKERERLGLEGGEKIGRHRVPKSKVTVQLGEDLAESLRQVKPEGNLFKDRFLALQKKSLIEPRVPQLCVLLSSLTVSLCEALIPGQRRRDCGRKSTKSTPTSGSSRRHLPALPLSLEFSAFHWLLPFSHLDYLYTLIPFASLHFRAHTFHMYTPSSMHMHNALCI